MQTIIKAQVIDQAMRITSLPKLASGGAEEIRVEVTFCDKWDGMGKTAVFYRNKGKVYQVVMVNDACVIPYEVMTEPGKVYFGVVGVKGETVRTSEVVALTVQQGSIIAAVPVPLPDVYAQLLTAYGQVNQRIADEEAKRSAEVAVERARIDNLAKLKDGSTTGDAELADIRVGYDGTTYDSAGAAVREQTKMLSGAIQSDGGTNPLQPLLFDHHQYYTGSSSGSTEVGLDVPQYNMVDLVALKSLETLAPATQFAVYARLATPVPVFQSFDATDYVLLVKTSAAFSSRFMFGYNPAWGANTLVSKIVNLSAGYNVVRLDGGTFADDRGYDTYRWVGLFSNSETGSFNYAQLETLEMYLIRGDAVLGWLQERAVEPETSVVCWGDSLTAHGVWDTTLANLSGMIVKNAGTGGEPSSTIMARQGADVMLVDGLTIPSGTTAVTLATYEQGFATELGRVVRPLLQGGSSHVNPVSIGGIEGTLAWTGSAYNDTSGVWTFTRAKAGDAVLINRPTAVRTSFDCLYNDRRNIPIIFMGTNDGVFDIVDMVNRHKLMVSHAKAERFLVLGMSRVPDSLKDVYESAMRNAFGRNFLSLREYLIAYGLADQGLTATAADAEAIENGNVPPQLLTDSVHYTDATKTAIGKQIYKRFCELGYC